VLRQRSIKNIIRATGVGGLLLGRTFLVSDLVCLVVGTGLIGAVDWLMSPHG